MATDETDELLSGGWQTDVRRIGGCCGTATFSNEGSGSSEQAGRN